MHVMLTLVSFMPFTLENLMTWHTVDWGTSRGGAAKPGPAEGILGLLPASLSRSFGKNSQIPDLSAQLYLQNLPQFPREQN